jgi:hypothetical protein
MSEATKKFLDFVQALKGINFAFPHLKPYFLAQCILECGRGKEKLFADHGNPFGMHYHDFLSDIATGVEYDAHDGRALYAKFDSFENAVKAYFRWFDHWSHYGDWRTPARKGGIEFLAHIGPHYCPPGYTEKWKNDHIGLKYHEYISVKLLGEAKDLLGVKDDQKNPLNVTWYEFYRLENEKGVSTGLVGWATDKAVFAMDGINSGDFNTIMLEHGRHNILVAPANKPWPGRVTPPKPPVEPPKPPTPGTPTLWIPGADTSIKATNMQGNYRKGFPEGAIVHFTAGNDDPKGTAQYLADKFPCLVMGRDGKIIQMFPLSKWAYHSGTEEHEYCVGIEICASGRVEKVNGGFKTWYDRILPPERVRWVDDKDNIQAGYYDKYSEEQEAALIKLLLWLKAQAPNIFDFDKVYGHDTVCDMHGQHGRKNDPGGALSMTIPELQKLLKKKYAEITK